MKIQKTQQGNVYNLLKLEGTYMSSRTCEELELYIDIYLHESPDIGVKSWSCRTLLGDCLGYLLGER